MLIHFRIFTAILQSSQGYWPLNVALRQDAAAAAAAAAAGSLQLRCSTFHFSVVVTWLLQAICTYKRDTNFLTKMIKLRFTLILNKLNCGLFNL